MPVGWATDGVNASHRNIGAHVHGVDGSAGIRSTGVSQVNASPSLLCRSQNPTR
jgi:hypothetical protein